MVIIVRTYAGSCLDPHELFVDDDGIFLQDLFRRWIGRVVAEAARRHQELEKISV